MKFLAFLTCASALFVLPVQADTVKSVYDGDTFTTSSGEKIRLACIDTPEMRNTAKKKADKPAAIAARDYLISLIGTADLTIDRVNTDFYGRTVARVYTPDGKELSREMFNSGHAQLFKNYTKPCPWAQQ
jgi:endonuclease YncB( thermonuclease family)